MSASIVIGKIDGDGALRLDVPTLIDTRALITGNSGAGKSRLLRRLAEQAFGKVQVIVVDPEGEFATLRERHGFLLAGRSGEVQAEPRAAALLAKRLMELRTSAVLDLYDLRLQQRREFVRLFLEALVDLPKDLYAPVLLLLDEAHLFCPEKAEAESAGAVIDLMTRGRKRGICGVLATQRLSKLDKDAAAEAKNVFVGGITLDIDQKRAADTLGLAGRTDRLALRDIPPGRFLAFGPALSQKGVTTFTAGETFTTHPKAGQRHKLEASPTPDAIRRIAAELKDLPQQAAEEIRTLQAAQAKVRELQREIKTAKAAQPPMPRVGPAKRIEVPILKDVQVKRLERAVALAHETAKALVDGTRERYNRALTAQGDVSKHAQQITAVLEAAAAKNQPNASVPVRGLGMAGVGPGQRSPAPAVVRPAGNGIGSGERRILVAVAQHQAGVTREQLTVLTGYKRSSRDTYLQRLRSGGYVDERHGRLMATEAAVAALGDAYEPLPTGDRLREHWIRRLPVGERRLFERIVAAYPSEIAREVLTEALGYKRSSRDTYLQRLIARRLVLPVGRGSVRAAEELFG